MSFLDSTAVTKTSFWKGRKITMPLTSEDRYSQYFHLYMPKGDGPYKTEICIRFNKTNPCPKKISISAEQSTVPPLPLTVRCYKRGARTPYISEDMKKMGSGLILEHDTTRIVISCTEKHRCSNKIYTRLSVNHIAK